MGWLLFHNSDTDSHTSQASETGTEVHDPTHGHDLQQNEAGEWTCSMHPQIRQDKPGKCPICAMDLIPVRKSSFSDKAIDPNAIQLSEEAAGEKPESSRQAAAAEPPREEAGLQPFGEKRQRLVGEAFRTYLIIEYGDDELLLIDKHAAHERILYEKLKKESGKSCAQYLLEPIPVTLDKNEYAAVLENQKLFWEAGFEVEDFGGGSVLVRSAPLSLEQEDIASSLMEIAGHLLENKTDMSTEKLDWLYHNIACRAAVKAGQITSDQELIALAVALRENPEIRYCPHGRPVSITLKKREIEKQFGRIQ